MVEEKLSSTDRNSGFGIFVCTVGTHICEILTKQHILKIDLINILMKSIFNMC